LVEESNCCKWKVILVAHLGRQYLQTLPIPNLRYRYEKVLRIPHPQFMTHDLGTGIFVHDGHISSLKVESCSGMCHLWMDGVIF
jgi:hypothetical protein